MTAQPADPHAQAASAVLRTLARAARVRLPTAARACLMPVAFACVGAVSSGRTEAAERLVRDLWQVVARPGQFATGRHWFDEPVYLDGTPYSRRDVAAALTADGVSNAGVALFIGTAAVAPWNEYAASFAFSEDQPRKANGQWGSADALPASTKERKQVLAEPAHPDTWGAKAGAKTVGEARRMVESLDAGRRVEHPSGAVGEVIRKRGKSAVKFPDRTVTLDQMGRDVQHLKPTDKAARHTPNPPAGWQVGDDSPVPKGAWMGKSKTVGAARQRLGQLADGHKIVTPSGRLGEVVNMAPEGQPRVPGVKVLGHPATPLASYPSAAVPHFRIITRDPYKQKLTATSPARTSLGVKTAGAALSALERLPVGDRILDHATGKVGTRVQVPVSQKGAKIQLMKPGIQWDGERQAVPLDSYTGDPVKSLEWIKPDLKPPEPEQASPGALNPPPGLVGRVLGKVGAAIGKVIKRVALGSDPVTQHTPEQIAVRRYRETQQAKAKPSKANGGGAA